MEPKVGTRACYLVKEITVLEVHLSQHIIKDQSHPLFIFPLLCQSGPLSSALFLFPPQFNKIIDIYIVCLGLEGGMKTGLFETPVKPHEFGGVYFHFKGRGQWDQQN